MLITITDKTKMWQICRRQYFSLFVGIFGFTGINLNYEKINQAVFMDCYFVFQILKYDLWRYFILWKCGDKDKLFYLGV